MAEMAEDYPGGRGRSKKLAEKENLAGQYQYASSPPFFLGLARLSGFSSLEKIFGAGSHVAVQDQGFFLSSPFYFCRQIQVRSKACDGALPKFEAGLFEFSGVAIRGLFEL